MSLINFILGPKLIREYAIGGQGSKLYEPTMFLEVWGEKLLGFLSMAYSIGFYTSPFICTFLYRRGYFVAESISSVAKLTTGIGIIYILSIFMRGVGRSQSPAYARFIRALEMSKSSATESKRLLSLFDFDFKHWKVDY
uniref:Phosphatidylserine Lipase ABHD16 N-terminal domain-containing protein n=1 Tax=Megaselia scalaris TaxID=36166 RepID=T1H403_MEGSC